MSTWLVALMILQAVIKCLASQTNNGGSGVNQYIKPPYFKMEEHAANSGTKGFLYG